MTEASPAPGRRVPGWLPLILMVILMFAIGAYAATRSPDFLSSYNLNTLLGSSGALPLAFVAMGQTCALMIGGFAVSVGAVTSHRMVVGLFTTASELAWRRLVCSSYRLAGCRAVRAHDKYGTVVS